MKYIILIIAFLDIGCSTMCKTVLEEPVSFCRAKKECGGAGAGMGMILSGFGSGLSHTNNQAVDNYNMCIDRNLDAQKYNNLR